MNAPEFDHTLHRAPDIVHGPVEHANRWGTRFLPGGARTLWILVGLGLLVLLIWAIRPSTKTGNAQHEAFGVGGPVPVGVARVGTGNIAVTLNALGAVTPLATVTVKPQVSGILDKINFQEGQMVKAGALLAEIDPRPYQAALDQAKGSLARDQAQLANAKVDLSRYQSLAAQNAIASQTLAAQAALVRTDAGTVETDNAAVEAAAINLGYCRIVSPVAGRVGLRQVDVGNLMQPGVTAGIAVVTELQPISVIFTLPEDDISAVMQRIGAGATLTADAYDRTQTTRLASGTLATVDNEIDPTTGTVKLRAMFDNADFRLFPQQFVNIRLLVNTLAGQTTAPVAAIQRGADGSFVYVVNANRTVSVRAVTLGPTNSNTIDVASGLRAGDIVVVDGADRLKDGAKVTVPGASRGTFGKGAGARTHHHHRSQGGDDTGTAP
ncbi:MAG TPA: efflux RND transporter periplasmic adaptor subunit [Rhizomicrobium sp.]